MEKECLESLFVIHGETHNVTSQLDLSLPANVLGSNYYLVLHLCLLFLGPTSPEKQGKTQEVGVEL